jgi:hypothetical protein
MGEEEFFCQIGAEIVQETDEKEIQVVLLCKNITMVLETEMSILPVDQKQQR